MAYCLALARYGVRVQLGSDAFMFMALWLSCTCVGYLLSFTEFLPPLFGKFVISVAVTAL